MCIYCLITVILVDICTTCEINIFVQVEHLVSIYIIPGGYVNNVGGSCMGCKWILEHTYF